MSKHNDSTPPQKKHRGLIVVIIVAVILIAIAAAGNGASNGSSNSSGDSASQSQDSANNPAASDSSASDSSAKIDADKFEKIESGMTYDQVKEIIGSDGTEQSTSAVGNTTTTIYEWDSDSFGVATVTFQDDKVVNKAQAGVGNKSTGTATMDKYNQVQTGMSYDQVKEIMGGDGELESDTDVSGSKSQLYLWNGESVGSNASITFTDGAVSSKAQFGLDE